jgi:hypothetical protein
MLDIVLLMNGNQDVPMTWADLQPHKSRNALQGSLAIKDGLARQPKTGQEAEASSVCCT